MKRGTLQLYVVKCRANGLCSARIRLSVKMNDEYKDVRSLPAPLLAQQGQVGPARPKDQRKMITAGREFVFAFFWP